MPVTTVASILVCALSPLDPKRDRLRRPTDPRFAIALALLSRPSQVLPTCTDNSAVGYARTFVFANTATGAYLVWLATDPCGKPLAAPAIAQPKYNGARIKIRTECPDPISP